MRLEPLPLDLPQVEQQPRMPLGFRAGATRAGIKASGGLDLGVLAATGRPASVAGAFTTNLFRAAPVRLSQAHLAATEPSGNGHWGQAAAVLSTNGCANAATGQAGERDQQVLCETLAQALGVEGQLIQALSTGLIGTRLPVDGLKAKLVPLVAEGLAQTDESLVVLAEQMCTTDSRPKWASTQLELVDRDGYPRTVTVSGIAKGVGMIHPRMATMLALVLTDAWVDPGVLHGILKPAVARTWNQLTVDADTSTNDTVLLLASGASGATSPTLASTAAGQLGQAVMAVARSLARQQAADGEGATTLITCQVSGARDDTDARAVARAVVASNLVKAAVYGRDPNWGRICSAAGNALVDGRPVLLAPEKLHVTLCGVDVFAGEPVPFDAAALSQRMAEPEILARLDLGLGEGSGEAFGCDLSEGYVVENSAYST